MSLLTRLPLNFPPLREMAERAEKEHHAMVTRIALDSGTGPTLPWAIYRTGAGAAWGIDVRRRLLSDLTRPESQAVWLRWLAEQVGVRAPDVGAPEWRSMCEGCVYQLGFGRNIALIIVGALDRLGTVAIHGMGVPVVQCPLLDNPDSDDAPIRAFVLAILTVGGER